MKALVYRKSVPRYLACALAARLAPRRFFPDLAPLGLEEVPFDPPRGWLPLTPLLCGVCGSDLGLLRGAHELFGSENPKIKKKKKKLAKIKKKNIYIYITWKLLRPLQ